MPSSDAYDVIVIGAGAGGMTAAAVAASEGLRVLVIEKTAFVGGTTAWSGGMVWIPVNGKMKQAGLADSPSDAANYLAATVPETENADLREAFLARGPEAVDYLEAHTEVRLQPVRTYPDYFPQMPGSTAGGRVLEPVTFDGARLGSNFRRLRPPLPEFTVFGGMMVNRLDIPHLRKVGRSLRSTLRAMRLVSQYALQRLSAPRGTTLHLGNALAARLYASLLARGVEVRFGAEVERLSIEGDAVTGVSLKDASGARAIVARRGVVLATGGFARKILSRGVRFGFRHGARRHRRRLASGGIPRRRPEHTGGQPCLLGAGVALHARRRQRRRVPAYGDRPGQARRDRGQCGGKTFCQ